MVQGIFRFPKKSVEKPALTLGTVALGSGSTQKVPQDPNLCAVGVSGEDTIMEDSELLLG